MADPIIGDGVVNGTPGDDIIIGGAGNDTLRGFAGDDILDGRAGDDILNGGFGNDTVTYDMSASFVRVDLTLTSAQNTRGAGNDTLIGIENIQGSAYDDILLGDAGINFLRGGAGNDSLYGRGGNDVLQGGAAADLLHGGFGFDTADYSDAIGRVVVDLQNMNLNVGFAAGDSYVSIEQVIGTRFNDGLRGDAGANTLEGEKGNDFLYGRAGDDVLFGGDGGDLLHGGAGIDRAEYADATAGVLADLVNAGANTGFAAGDTYVSIEQIFGSSYDDILRGNGGMNTLAGKDGNDLLYGRGGDDVLRGGNGGDAHFGGAGIDRADYEDATGGVLVDLLNVSLNTGFAAGDTYVNIEQVFGSSYDDDLRGNGISNTLAGKEGVDLLYGRGGDDVLRGGDGGDSLFGGAGSDAADYVDATSRVVADLQDASQNKGFAAGDIYTSIEELRGSNYHDGLRGNALANVLSGREGNDVLYGRAGSDVLLGGAGKDTMYGGAHADKFRFQNGDFGGVTVATADRIGDFSQAQGDLIDLSRVDADISGGTADDAFTWIGTSAFSGTAGELRYEQSASTTDVFGDLDGDGNADFMIHMTGAIALQETDFIL